MKRKLRSWKFKIRELTFRNNLRQGRGTKTFTAIIYKEENIYVTECPEVGISREEVLRKRLLTLKK